MELFEMDNVNVIRVGFMAPAALLTTTEMNTEDPVRRKSGTYTCLVFANPDEKGIKLCKVLEQGLPSNNAGIEWQLAIILPLKAKPAQEFKAKHQITAQVYCDGELKAGKSYSIVDSQSDRPSYHPTIFIVGDEGSVRQRFNLTESEFDLKKFSDSIAAII